MLFYKGPGIYKHYKGGFYRILGVGQHESAGAKFVIYHSYDIEHETARSKEGVDFVCRPLNPVDGDDAFNSRAENGMPRFVKVL